MLECARQYLTADPCTSNLYAVTGPHAGRTIVCAQHLDDAVALVVDVSVALLPRCLYCDTNMDPADTGRPRRYCSNECRQAGYRARQA